ncbi:unnamed protein product [Arabis nemorensis]|uniref:Uncharacterized protein n=1 Tax=Arabis nemorensis TaxID=586526 RepID=A0A565CFV8_9BRAS|nr:unnamed protein product [Arabis nemorensis]
MPRKLRTQETRNAKNVRLLIRMENVEKERKDSNLRESRRALLGRQGQIYSTMIPRLDGFGFFALSFGERSFTVIE